MENEKWSQNDTEKMSIDGPLQDQDELIDDVPMKGTRLP